MTEQERIVEALHPDEQQKMARLVLAGFCFSLWWRNRYDWIVKSPRPPADEPWPAVRTYSSLRTAIDREYTAFMSYS